MALPGIEPLASSHLNTAHHTTPFIPHHATTPPRHHATHHHTTPHATTPHPTSPQKKMALVGIEPTTMRVLETSENYGIKHQDEITSPHLISSHLTSPHFTSPLLTSPHLTSLTSPHLTSLTSPHLTSPNLTETSPGREVLLPRSHVWYEGRWSPSVRSYSDIFSPHPPPSFKREKEKKEREAEREEGQHLMFIRTKWSRFVVAVILTLLLNPIVAPISTLHIYY